MGMSITWAAVLGAAARLRPILMTSLAMVVGLLPMMFAFGGMLTDGWVPAIRGMFVGMIFRDPNLGSVRSIPVPAGCRSKPNRTEK